jgi:hypothetical protein
MLDIEILIRKIPCSVNTRRARAIAMNEITALDHEFGNHAMEPAAFEALGLHLRVFGLAGAELAEISGGRVS